jgi:hypothetical protein
MADRADPFFTAGCSALPKRTQTEYVPMGQPNRQNWTTLDTEMGWPIGDALRSRGADFDSVGCPFHVHVVAHMPLKAPLVLEV